MKIPSAPTTRLHVLLARDVPAGVILRRGPSKQVLLIRWDTARDTFETGQWFKGRIYERRCDLSPDGQRLIYFAAKWAGPMQTWTAISRPPFLSALALWPKGDAWNGGGRFLTSSDIILNHFPGEAQLHPDFRERPVRVVGHAERRGEDDTVYHARLERDGWGFVARGAWREVRSPKSLHWEADPPEVWRTSHTRGPSSPWRWRKRVWAKRTSAGMRPNTGCMQLRRMRRMRRSKTWVSWTGRIGTSGATSFTRGVVAFIGVRSSGARSVLPGCWRTSRGCASWGLRPQSGPSTGDKPMELTIPELALVVLIGPSGSGKSTFAARHFLPTEVLSSDRCRGLVSDDENDQAATDDAFAVLHFIAARRLAAGRLTVVDATNVQPEARRPLVALARQFHCLPVAVVLDLPERLCHGRNADRPERTFGPHVVRQHRAQLHKGLRGLAREGFRHVHVLSTPEEVVAATFTRQPLWNNRRGEHGPFDIIGDLHGCFDELCELLERLGYTLIRNDAGTDVLKVVPPAGRRAVFVGDLVDRGPKIPQTVELVMGMVSLGGALCVPGNHDVKFMRAVWGKNVKVAHDLAESLEQFAAYEREQPHARGLTRRAADWIDKLVSHYVFDDGKLVVAHAGMKESMQGRGSGGVREFALYGETTGETDEFGLPVRLNWAAEYRGRAHVVYGHTPVPRAEWLNRTIDIDTGCVFGGALTALRYPEMELESVPARETYCEPARPFLVPEVTTEVPELSAQQAHDDVLDLEDVLGKRIVATDLRGNVTVREENATAALEVMSRFAVDPRWLIYLPPTMSPCETSQAEGLLEHPAEALAYYHDRGIFHAVCQEKHMGSRAVVVVCRDADAARARFGVLDGSTGTIYTRTGRRFFDGEQAGLETGLLDRLRAATTGAGLWEELSTDWLCLDCELMPWSAKARALLETQYAPVGSAARAGLTGTITTLEQAAARHPEVSPMLEATRARLTAAERYVTAYRGYCWEVSGVEDLRLAPFHLLASEGQTHFDKDHPWHLGTLARLAVSDPVLLATATREVELSDAGNTAEAAAWWEELTGRGGEGMVVKPRQFIARGGKRGDLLQPALKCRGPEYLRIIYGPDYLLPENLSRLRSRGLGAKRSLALREFALGVESLERFAIRREPLRRVHECVFGVLALESEPVDPRL